MPQFTIWEMRDHIASSGYSVKIMSGNAGEFIYFFDIKDINGMVTFTVNGTKQDSRKHSFKLQFGD